MASHLPIIPTHHPSHAPDWTYLRAITSSPGDYVVIQLLEMEDGFPTVNRSILST